MSLKINHLIYIVGILSLNNLIPTSYATSVNDVCHNFWNGLAVATPPSISPWQVQNGLDIPVPLNIWCSWRKYGQHFSSGIPMFASTVEENDNDGDDFSITNSNDNNVSIPVKWCIGKEGFDNLCFDHTDSYMPFSFDSSADLLPELFQYDKNSTDPCGKGSNSSICQGEHQAYHYQLMSYLELQPDEDTDYPVTPGRYIGTFSLYSTTFEFPSGSLYSSPIIYNNSSGLSEKIVVTIRDSCHIEAPDTVDLGSAPFPNQLSSGIENLKVQCTVGTPYKITFQGNQDTSTSQHRLAFNNNYIPYKLFNTANNNSIIGKKGIKGRGTGKVKIIPIEVKVDPHATAVPAGKYKDTITVTLTY